LEKKIAFDIDGVLTEPTYIPKEERTRERYLQLEPNKDVCDLVKKLIYNKFEVYLISSRNLGTNNMTLGTWFDNTKCGLKWHMFYGKIHFNVPKKQKAYLAEKLGCAILVDDDIDAITECDGTVVQGVLLCHKHRFACKEYTEFTGNHPDQIRTYVGNLENKIVRYFKEAGIDVE